MAESDAPKHEDIVLLGQDFSTRPVNFFWSSQILENRLLDLFNLTSFITVEPLRQLLTERMAFEDIRRFNKILRIIATNWETSEIDMYGDEDMADIGYNFARQYDPAMGSIVPA